jgi:anthranilate phosphoribosyltransferase
VKTFTIQPEDFGLSRCQLSDLQVTSAQESANIIRQIFAGAPGPARDIVSLNAGAALYIGDAVSCLSDGVKRAQEVIDSGAATRTLDDFIPLTHIEDV